MKRNRRYAPKFREDVKDRRPERAGDLASDRNFEILSILVMLLMLLILLQHVMMLLLLLIMLYILSFIIIMISI
jgi:Flp pilus assembly protein TadB